ncbi:uncharacterized mitochondrial protein AtMg00810-like [Lathyrus oleraceus]|uniref:uncharacterized mitochondrial protein AtMg00810-like n=1 Tax=Pisum sativum TaxID=3888 RepID=UPI0021D3B4B5|nr:uncharacterized mitochondrial protein AtMg00810-like [Pisum sativum]
MTIVRCLLNVVVTKGWTLHQMNMSNDLLHAELDEEVYMEVPPGYNVFDKEMMKNLGELRYFLGLELARGSYRLFICKRKYALDILNECGMLACNPSSTPLEPNHNLALDSSPLYENPSQYHSQFMHEPHHGHWDAAMHVLRYLKSSLEQGIIIPRDNDLRLVAYCDSNYASCPLTRRSVSGYVIKLGTTPISWKTKKQTTVSRSSSEADYRAMAHATSEVIWL